MNVADQIVGSGFSSTELRNKALSTTAPPQALIYFTFHFSMTLLNYIVQIFNLTHFNQVEYFSHQPELNIDIMQR